MRPHENPEFWLLSRWCRTTGARGGIARIDGHTPVGDRDATLRRCV